MRICLIGKFPPIQGGVSMRTYWTAHALAARGHEVHVVTNAKEVRPPFRMHMRAQDWQRCEASYDGGSVTVHWSDPVDRSQAYIPMASPFVSKLAGIAVRLHAEHPLTCPFVLSGALRVAGPRGANDGVPHVPDNRKHAGHLWRIRSTTSDHLLRSSAGVIAGKAVATRAVNAASMPIALRLRAASSCRCLYSHRAVPRLAALRAEVASDPDLSGAVGQICRRRPYLGSTVNSAKPKARSLLAAMQRLKNAGLDVGLVALARATRCRGRRAQARDFGLADTSPAPVPSPLAGAGIHPRMSRHMLPGTGFRSGSARPSSCARRCCTGVSRRRSGGDPQTSGPTIAGRVRLRRNRRRERRRHAEQALAAIVADPAPARKSGGVGGFACLQVRGHFRKAGARSKPPWQVGLWSGVPQPSDAVAAEGRKRRSAFPRRA